MKAYKSLRHLQLFVTFLNLVNQYLILTWKLFCIGLGIASGYAAIAHFTDYPMFGLMYYALFFDVLMFYAFLYEKGFKVAASFDQTNAVLMLKSRKGLGGTEWKIVKRQVRSIPSVGIKVGEFHMLERTSTPVFLHYVLSNVVNMLVVYG